MQFIIALYWIFYFYLCFEWVIGDFGGVAKKCDGFTIILAELLVQWWGLKISAGRSKAARRLRGQEREFSWPWFGGCVTQGCRVGNTVINMLPNLKCGALIITYLAANNMHCTKLSNIVQKFLQGTDSSNWLTYCYQSLAEPE